MAAPGKSQHETPPAAMRTALPQPAPQAPFRVEQLLERCLSDREFCGTLVQRFAEHIAERATALEQALAGNVADDLMQHAHAIKGMAANLSADNLHFWAGALERAVRGGNTGQLRPLVARVRAEVNQCLDAVPHLLDELTEKS
ncbi:MAG: Hpt domain-containing protein [Pirellulales bacterium]